MPANPHLDAAPLYMLHMPKMISWINRVVDGPRCRRIMNEVLVEPKSNNRVLWGRSIATWGHYASI
jgi:hypothetical protein